VPSTSCATLGDSFSRDVFTAGRCWRFTSTISLWIQRLSPASDVYLQTLASHGNNLSDLDVTKYIYTFSLARAETMQTSKLAACSSLRCYQGKYVETDHQSTRLTNTEIG
jgi:hypothetical protein